ncbi:MAG TPA: efflux RND transporter periplasmic adaptor subunit [Bryobacteraceae bacterium]|nr:efflux RND transporter periplasmic adaptor subunit [Bryobacteraceae bacterium]
MKIVTIIVVSLASLLAVGCTGKGASAPAEGASKGGKKGGGDVPVTITKVSTREVPIEIQVIGNVEAYSTITVRAQATGELTKVFFQEGDYVKTGDVLFHIDRRPIEAEMNQVKANLRRQDAQLKQAEANMAKNVAQLQYAEAQSARSVKLFEQGLISKEQADQTSTNANVFKQTVAADRAAIESVRADMAATQAALETSEVRLSYTEIRSPINGRTGNLLLKQGNLVTANNQDMVMINQVQPIYVTFAVPEAQLPAIKSAMAVGKLPVFAKPQDDETVQEGGLLTFVDNNVDMSTGTIKLKGTFPNTALKLWPGQFVRVTLRLSTRANALVVPNQAVQAGQDGPYVYVVKADRSVESRRIATGPRVDQDLVIEDGLALGETVILEGQLRLAPGMKVQVRDPAGAPSRKKRPS